MKNETRLRNNICARDVIYGVCGVPRSRDVIYGVCGVPRSRDVIYGVYGVPRVLGVDFDGSGLFFFVFCWL